MTARSGPLTQRPWSPSGPRSGTRGSRPSPSAQAATGALAPARERSAARSSLPSRWRRPRPPARGARPRSAGRPGRRPGRGERGAGRPPPRSSPPRRWRVIEIVAGARVERALEPRTTTPRSTAARRRPRADARRRADLEARAALGVERERVAVAVRDPSWRSGRDGGRPAPGREPDPDRDGEAVGGAQVGIVRRPRRRRPVRTGCGRGSRSALDGDRPTGSPPGRRRPPRPAGSGAAETMNAQPLAGARARAGRRSRRRRPSRPVRATRSASAGGAALTSSIASATCSHDQRKSSIGWLSAGCSR